MCANLVISRRSSAIVLAGIAAGLLLGSIQGAELAVTVEKDVDYLGMGRTEKADLYLPANSTGKRRPAVVIIHGGGWTGGDKGAAREQNIGNTLASHGYVGMSINYRLQPAEGPRIWPQNLHDCKTAVRWLRAQAERLAIDTAHIGVIGGSAGGHLAAMVGVTGPEAGLDPPGPYGEHSCRVQAVVDLYGPLADSPARQKTLLGENPANAETMRKQITPLSHLDRGDPPFLILHGTADKTVPVRDSEVLAEALKTAGIVQELVVIPDAPHTFHLQPKQRDLRPLVLAFFERHLRPQTSGGE